MMEMELEGVQWFRPVTHQMKEFLFHSSSSIPIRPTTVSSVLDYIYAQHMEIKGNCPNFVSYFSVFVVFFFDSCWLFYSVFRF